MTRNRHQHITGAMRNIRSARAWIAEATDCLSGIAKAMPLWTLPALPFIFLALIALLLFAYGLEGYERLTTALRRKHGTALH